MVVLCETQSKSKPEGSEELLRAESNQKLPEETGSSEADREYFRARNRRRRQRIIAAGPAAIGEDRKRNRVKAVEWRAKQKGNLMASSAAMRIQYLKSRLSRAAHSQLLKMLDWKDIISKRRAGVLTGVKISFVWPVVPAWTQFTALAISLNNQMLKGFQNQHIYRLLTYKPEVGRIRNTKTKLVRSEYNKRRRLDPKIGQALRDYSKKDFQNRKHKIYAYRNHRRATNPQFRISSSLRTYIYQRVGKKNRTGESRFRSIVGCPIEVLCQWLESQFESWMDWDNYGMGVGKWSIDHIRPCASFDLTDEVQVWECFHYSNMRPLAWIENLMKGDKLLTTLAA